MHHSYDPLSCPTPYSRPSISDCTTPRPHTVHASTAPAAIHLIAEEEETSEGDITPRSSAAGPSRPLLHPRSDYEDLTCRRMSRDDTANDLHELTSSLRPRLPALDIGDSKDSHPLAPTAVSKETRYGPPSSRLHRMVKRPLSRIPGHLTPSAGAEPSESASVVDNSKSTSFGRRFSTRNAKERMHEWRENMTGRGRRTSTPQRMELGDCLEPIPVALPCSGQPTSPSKRSARQGDDRPRKHRGLAFQQAIGDRRDTPAPVALPGLPMRPASSRHAPAAVVSAPGGDGARKAAALHNFVTYSSLPGPPEWDDEDEDGDAILARRGRLGSLSSAADSGADLSTYSGSEASIPDPDGDITMAVDDDHCHRNQHRRPVVTDFTRRLPAELAVQVFQYLDANDLLRAEKVSRQWYYMISDVSVWRSAFLGRYQRQVLIDPPPIQVGGVGIGMPGKTNQEWKKMYKARVDLEKNWRAGSSEAGKAVYLSGHTDSVYCVQFDEEKIITGSRDRTIRVWDINTYQCIRVIGAPQHRPQLGPKVLRTVDYPSFHMATASVNGTAYGDSIYHVPREWHDASILCLQYDEKILVTGSSDSDLLIWDIKTYEPIKRLRKHTGGVLDVALDGKHIVSCSKDSRIIVWDRETLEPKGELTGHRGPVNAVQLRGHLLVSASGDGIARLWDLHQMKLIKEFSAKERGLAAVEFSEDMKYVLAGGNDNITYKFETESGREVMQFTGHSQLVRSLWLDSANNRVVSGSYDLDLRVYDFLTGQELWRGEEWTTSWMLAAKSDYRRIVATSQDGRILVVDFGIYKGPPEYRSRDGMHIDNIDLLRGAEDLTGIKFRNPWDPTKSAYGFH